MARLEIDINDSATFAEILYDNFRKACDKAAPGMKAPMWDQLGMHHRYIWRNTARGVLASYMKAEFPGFSEDQIRAGLTVRATED